MQQSSIATTLGTAISNEAANTVVPRVPPSPTTPWTQPHKSYAEAERSLSPNGHPTVVVRENSNSVF
ncbi:hypothetical protein J6590_009344 [Homalodisca vitripennis]|nr:hypothetical protein J6590_009344 [Homalodisca vitripennis]